MTTPLTDEALTEIEGKLHAMHDLVFAAHTRCLELTRAGVRGFTESPVGMSHGPFSAINEVCRAFTGQKAEIARLKRCITMAMGCLDVFASKDQALAWYRLKDALDGREPRDKMEDTP